MDLAQPLPSDGQLVDATRRGSVPAWAELEARHGAAVLAVARAHRSRQPRRVAQQAMERVHDSVIGDAPVPDGSAAVRAFRPRVIAELVDGSYGPGADAPAGDVPAGDAEALAEGFARLPETWQTVLWHGIVEQRPAAEMTPLLGRGVNDVIAAQHTARAGLHKSYLRAVSERADLADECCDVVPLLGAFGRGTLTPQDQRAVDEHLLAGRDGDPCRDCRARVDLLATLDERLPSAIVPGITRLSADRYRAVIGSGNGAFGTAALFAARSNRVRKLAMAGAAVAAVLAVVGAFLLVRQPFEASSQSPTIVPVTVAPPAGTAVDAAVDADPPSSTVASETTAPTTTELLLRPPPTGPANTVELGFVAGTRAIGAVAPELDLTVEMSAPGRVFAGGTGTVDVAITNASGVAVEAVVEIGTPDGLSFDALAAGVATCRDPADATPFCNISIGSGETNTLALRFGLESTVVGRLVVESSLGDEPLEVGIVATPRLVHSSVGRGDIVSIGNTVMSCADESPDCAGARDLTGEIVNRWDVPIVDIGAVPLIGWSNSSSARLDLPAGATVEAAYLFWSGDLSERGQQVPNDGSRAEAGLIAPGAELPVVVEADRLLLGDVDATQYLGHADVTEIVAAGGPGDYLVGNIQSVGVQGSYAGWSLVVVTSDDGLPRRQHLVTSPFSWFAPDIDHRSGLPVPFGSAQTGTLDVLAFEGEPGFLPERFEVGGVVLGGDNEFDGSVTGERDPAFVNSFGIDLETYDLSIDAPDGILPINATSDKDGVRLAVYGLAVDLEQ